MSLTFLKSINRHNSISNKIVHITVQIRNLHQQHQQQLWWSPWCRWPQPLLALRTSRSTSQFNLSNILTRIITGTASPTSECKIRKSIRNKISIKCSYKLWIAESQIRRWLWLNNSLRQWAIATICPDNKALKTSIILLLKWWTKRAKLKIKRLNKSYNRLKLRIKKLSSVISISTEALG